MLLRSLVVLLLWTSAAVVAELPGTDYCKKSGICSTYRAARTTGRNLLQKEKNYSQNEQVVEAPLLAAARTGSAAAVGQLLPTGVDVNEIGINGHTALWEASRRGIPKIVDALLAAGAEPNIASENGMTPLYMASEAGNLKVVKALLRHGADIESATNKGATPILMAAQAGNEDVVAFLIEKQANVSVEKTTSGQSALWSAAFFGYQGIVQRLVEAGANVNDAEASGATSSYAASQEGHIAALLVLVEKGADVTLSSNTGATPLHVAAAACQVNIVSALLLFGGNPLARDSSGRRPADSICRGMYPKKNRSKIARLLQFAASLDKDVSLEDVLAQGVKFKPEILEWIARLLNPIAYLADHSLNQETVQERAPSGRSRASGTKTLFVVLPILSVIILVVTLRFFVTRNSIPSNRPQRRQLPTAPSPKGQVFTLNPLAYLESESLTESVRTIGWLPPWRTPQIPRPTCSKASQDANPGPLVNVLENSADFSREGLIEWLQEPQAFAPSQKWDLEPQVPEAAKSEGSISSSHGAGIYYWLSQSQSFSSLKGQMARKRSSCDADSQVSEELSQSQAGPSDQRRLWRIDHKTLNFFSSRKSGASDLMLNSDSVKENEKVNSLTGSQLEQSTSESVIKDCETQGRSLEPSPQTDLSEKNTDASM